MADWQIALLVALIAALPGLYAIWRQRKKTDSSVAETYELMATKQANQISDLRKCQQELEDKMEELEGYVNQLEAGIELLVNQLKANNIEPIWRPKKRVQQ